VWVNNLELGRAEKKERREERREEGRGESFMGVGFSHWEVAATGKERMWVNPEYQCFLQRMIQREELVFASPCNM
jgi:hypothetical protein